MKWVCALFCFLLASARADDEDTKIEGTVIGVDLGTTYSCVGVMKKGRVEIIANEQGNRITPSVVSWDPESGERQIGDGAKHQATLFPTTTVYDAKRLIGRLYHDSEVQKDKAYFSFEMTQSHDQKPNIQVPLHSGVKEFTPEEVSAMVLSKMKSTAEKFLGEPVKQAVVTVPAYFNDAQRKATKDAGQIAGLQILRIINEPTAAAIAFGLDKKKASDGEDGQESIVMVFDLGGGTFDVTLLEVDQGVFMVMATGGDTHLGGEDFDQRLMNYFMKIFKRKTGLDVMSDKRALQKLRKECERAKRALSTETRARVEIEQLMGGEDLSETVTRAKFEQLNQDLFQRTLEPVQKVLDDAEVTSSDVTDVVLVGGSTRIPKIRQMMKDFFGGKEPHTGLNPDEAVAHGAAIQAGILSGDTEGDVKDLLLMDVTPLSLGTEVHGGRMDVLIKRNTVIPKRVTKEYFTVSHGQSYVKITVYEGEREVAQYNNKLGEFQLDLPSPPAGYPFAMTFQLDENGMLMVIGEDKSTGTKQQIQVQASGRLSEDEITRMTEEAERHAESDKRFNARNDVVARVSGVKTLLEDEKFTEKVDEVALASLRDAVSEVSQWLDGPGKTAEEDELKLKIKMLDDLIKQASAGADGDGRRNGGSETVPDGDEDEDEHGEL